MVLLWLNLGCMLCYVISFFYKPNPVKFRHLELFGENYFTVNLQWYDVIVTSYLEFLILFWYVWKNWKPII